MDVYGILSGDVVRKTSDTVACALRGAHTQQVERLDHLFGNGNWFVYPDSNYQQIGVKRLARGFFVDGVNVEWVQTCQRKVQAGHTSPGDCGATVGLKSALQESDIPLWQRGAIQEWKKAASKSSTQGIT